MKIDSNEAYVLLCIASHQLLVIFFFFWNLPICLKIISLNIQIQEREKLMNLSQRYSLYLKEGVKAEELLKEIMLIYDVSSSALPCLAVEDSIRNTR